MVEIELNFCFEHMVRNKNFKLMAVGIGDLSPMTKDDTSFPFVLRKVELKSVQLNNKVLDRQRFLKTWATMEKVAYNRIEKDKKLVDDKIRERYEEEKLIIERIAKKYNIKCKWSS